MDEGFYKTLRGERGREKSRKYWLLEGKLSCVVSRAGTHFGFFSFKSEFRTFWGLKVHHPWLPRPPQTGQSKLRRRHQWKTLPQCITSFQSVHFPGPKNWVIVLLVLPHVKCNQLTLIGLANTSETMHGYPVMQVVQYHIPPAMMPPHYATHLPHTGNSSVNST